MALNLQEATLYLKKDKKSKKDGTLPLYIRFRRVDGKEPRFPMGVRILTMDWNSVTQKIADPHIDILIKKEFNRIMTEVRRLELDDVEVTFDMLREIVSQKNTKAERPENKSFYAYYIDYVTKRRNTGKIGKSTLKGYETTLKSLREFRGEVRIKDVNAKLLSDFEKFLIKRGEESGKGDVKGSRYNRIKHIRAIIRYIEAQNIPIKNPYRTGDLALPEDVVNEVFLEKEELERMYALLKDYKENSTEYRVLIMYLFACSTGLRIGDTMNLKWRDLIIESDPLVLGITMQKTKKELYLPIFPIAEDMLVRAPEGNIDNVEKEYYIFHFRYTDSERNRVNKTLKTMAAKAAIEKKLSFHSARRTFATLACAQGISLMELKAYMGHSSSKTTERYIKWSANLARESAQKLKLFEVEEALKY